MPATSRSLRSASLLAAFALSSCTAILVPDEDDDGVLRCDVTSDCPKIDLEPGADKVCSADYETIPCGSNAYPGDHPLSQLTAAAAADPSRYAACAASCSAAAAAGRARTAARRGSWSTPTGPATIPTPRS